VKERVRGDRVDPEHRQLQRVAAGINCDGMTVLDDRLLAPGGVPQRRDDDHPLADTRRAHALADGDDTTHSFGTQPRGQRGPHSIHAPDQQQIRWVDRRRLNRDCQLARAGIGRRHLCELHDVGGGAESRKLKGLHRNRSLRKGLNPNTHYEQVKG
jgi:hypothetical protein